MPTIDPELVIAPGWVRSWFGPLSDLCTTTLADEDGVPTVRCVVDPSHSERFAWRLAAGLAARKLAPRPGLFADWMGAAAGCTGPLPQDRVDRMIDRGLLVNLGTPAEPASDNHFFGLVGESTLYELLVAGCQGLGNPVLVEGHDWSVTDTGGDQLSVYDGQNGFFFRLWESKARHGATNLTTVVKGAAEQIDEKAASYLARFSIATSRSVADPALADFVALMPDLWADNDPRGGAGVGVTTHAAGAAETPFAQLAGHFNVPNASKTGHLTLLGLFPTYRATVSQTIWRGLGLWTGP